MVVVGSNAIIGNWNPLMSSAILEHEGDGYWRSKEPVELKKMDTYKYTWVVKQKGNIVSKFISFFSSSENNVKWEDSSTERRLISLSTAEPQPWGALKSGRRRAAVTEVGTVGPSTLGAASMTIDGGIAPRGSGGGGGRSSCSVGVGLSSAKDTRSTRIPAA